MNSENDLLKEYKKTGDLRLLGKLYEPYMPMLYGVCFRYYKDEARSEDAVMQIFESLIAKLRQHTVTHFKSWLYTIARNHCLMDLRRDQRVTFVGINEHFAESNAEAHLSTSATDNGGEGSIAELTERNLDLMEECLSQLSEEQRTCVQRFYLDQQCYQDIADDTGYALNKVKSYIQNGKRNLKICMERKVYGQ